MRKKSAGLGIRGKLFSEISDTFVKAALAGNIPRITARELFNSFNPDEGAGNRMYPFCVLTPILTHKLHLDYIDRALLSAFFNFAEPHLPEEVVEKFNSLREISDLRFPSEWFPDARQMQR